MIVPLAVALGLTACAAGGGTAAGQDDMATISAEPVASETSETSESTAPSEQASAPFTANDAPDTEDPSGNPVLVTNVELESAPTHDRVVVTTTDDGTAGWMAEYIEQATAQGSGEPVDVAGDATLQVLFTNVTYPTGDVDVYGGADRLSLPEATAITEVVVGSVFEGQFELWIGTSGRLPFRVTPGDTPNVIWIDVVHPDVAS